MNSNKHLEQIVINIENTTKYIDQGLKEMISYQIYETNQIKIEDSYLELNFKEIKNALQLIDAHINKTNYSKIITGLSALFLFKSGIIVHDEIGSGTPNSNGKDTLWWKWGPAQAINVGDSLYSLSRLLIINDKYIEESEILRILNKFDKMNTNIFKSKFLELQNSEQYKINFDNIVSIYELKEIEPYLYISELFDNTNLIKNIFKIIGEINLYEMHANAFKNLLSENLNYNFSKLENEILNKKKILPIAYIFKEYENDLEHIKKLGTIYMKRMLENNDIKLLHKLFYSNQVSKKYTNHIQKLKIKLEKLVSQNINNDLNINIQSLLQ
tara:strand:+ start:28 stop:1011 length:984 start_codon:yes stop_codon:yes gene_type:complete